MNSIALDYLRCLLHGILLFVGSGKTGKSCTAHSLAAMLWPGRAKVIYDPFDQLKTSPFPGYAIARTLDDIPNGSVVFFEDAARLFPSRGSAMDKTLQLWLGPLSHKDIIVIVTVQNTADLDVAFFRMQNPIFCHKLMYDEDVHYERDTHIDAQIDANRIIRRTCSGNPDVDRRAWVFFSRFNECLAVPVVSWWGREHSHMLAEVRVCPA